MTDELAKILRAERIERHIGEGYCPDCDDLCEPWTEDGVSCGDVVGEQVTAREAREYLEQVERRRAALL